MNEINEKNELNEINDINENENDNENEIQQLINNVSIPEDFKNNTQKENFFNFNDSIFTSIKDNTNKKINSENNGKLVDIIEDINE